MLELASNDIIAGNDCLTDFIMIHNNPASEASRKVANFIEGNKTGLQPVSRHV